MELAIDEWADGLSGLDGADVARGLACWDADWPPSLPEFVRACRPVVVLAAHRDFVRLPKPVVDRDLAAAAFADMKAALR